MMGLLLTILLISISWAWFSANQTVDATGMGVRVSGDDNTFDILVRRQARYDETDRLGEPVYPSIPNLKTELTTAGYSSAAEDVSVNEAGNLAFELVNEFCYDEKYSLMPDAYGHITFYVKPKTVAEHLTVDFQVTVGGYVYQEAETEGDEPELVAVDNETVLDLLKGHFLLFENRAGNSREDYQYTDLIRGTFSFDSDDYTLIESGDFEDCYEVTLYWEWPLTYSILREGIGDRYPSELSDYIENNRNYFFAMNQSSNNLEKLNDGYDDGDQTIGSGSDVILVYLTTN